MSYTEFKPHVMYIACDDSATLTGETAQRLVDNLLETHGGHLSEDQNSVDVIVDSVPTQVRFMRQDTSNLITCTTGALPDGEDLDVFPSKWFDQWQGKLAETLTIKPSMIFRCRLLYPSEGVTSESLLQKVIMDLKGNVRSLGIVEGSYLLFLKTPDENPEQLKKRSILIIPKVNDESKIEESVWGLCTNLSKAASHLGEITKLYNDRRLVFTQMDASESSTQLRINEILAEMRHPVDEIEPIDLENVLKEVSIQYSRLSTLAGSIRRDRIKAQGVYRRLNSLFKAWGEEPILGYTPNSTFELDQLGEVLAPFGDYIDRTEALMAQLNTVLDSVRTYLGIKQQKMSLSEEVSSKEQLIQLVNLQEIFHKVEIFIVAVYVTEMARIVFDTVIPRSANLVTALFIPVALLAAIVTSRVLHRERPAHD